MADQTAQIDELGIVQPANDIKYFDINAIQKLNFLKSCRFAIFFPSIPNCFAKSGYSLSPKILEPMRFLCDSIEFPGKALDTVEYKIAGLNRAKLPYLRRVNEITLSFYHETEFPMYDFFSEWIEIASPSDSNNSYYDDVVMSEMRLIQFETNGIGGETQGTPQALKYFTVFCKNVFPINFASIPGNWADEGYHKINVTFSLDIFEIAGYNSRSKIYNFSKTATTIDTPPTSGFV